MLYKSVLAYKMQRALPPGNVSSEKTLR